MPTGLSTLSIALILAIVVGLLLLLLRALAVAAERGGYAPPARRRLLLQTALGLMGWLGLVTGLSLAGVTADTTSTPPRPFLLLLPAFVAAVVIARGRRTERLIAALPPAWPIGIQSFRIVMELWLLLLFLDGMVPRQMTFEGWNFDIVTGILAIPTAIVVARRGRGARSWALAFNVIGLILLAAIVLISMFSTPGPLHLLKDRPPHTILGTFPFMLVPTFIVPVALMCHLISLRQRGVEG